MNTVTKQKDLLSTGLHQWCENVHLQFLLALRTQEAINRNEEEEEEKLLNYLADLVFPLQCDAIYQQIFHVNMVKQWTKRLWRV